MSENNTESHSFENNPSAVILQNTYFLVRLIYKGRSHNLYLALNRDHPDNYCVVEMRSPEQQTAYALDIKILKRLEDSKLVVLLPKIITKGEYKYKNSIYNYIIKERCGPSLKLCFSHCQNNFNNAVLATIAIKALTILECLHKAKIVHCNLKPKKFITLAQGNDLLITDFKFAQKFKLKGIMNQHSKNKFQYAQVLNKFSSLNIHLGIKPCPRDDLESLAYILINFASQGSLFRQKQQKSKVDKLKDVELSKMNMVLEKSLPFLPTQLIQFFYFVKMSNLTDYDSKKLNYEPMKQFFRKMLLKEGHDQELQFYPWNKKKKHLIQSASYISEESSQMDEQSNSSNLSVDSGVDSETNLPKHESQEESILQYVTNYENRERNIKVFIRQYQFLPNIQQ